MTKTGDTISYRRILAPPGKQSRYAVYVNGLLVGAVFSYTTHAYWGTKGWDRGHRIRDCHPIRWGYENREGDDQRVDKLTRREATQAMREDKP